MAVGHRDTVTRDVVPTNPDMGEIMTRNAKSPAPAPATDATPDAPKVDLPAVPAVAVPVIADVTPDDLAAVYVAADVATKAKIRKAVDVALRAAVDAADMGAAQHAMACDKSIKSAVATTTAREIDYAALIKYRVAVLIMAASKMIEGDIDARPADVPADFDFGSIFDDDTKSIMTGRAVAMAHDIPKDDGAFASAVSAVASAKVGAGTRAPKRDVKAHLSDVRDAVVSGADGWTYLPVSKIAGHASDAYGDDRPSGGAVAARLFRDGGPEVDRVTPVRKGETLPNGSTATADGAIFTA